MSSSNDLIHEYHYYPIIRQGKKEMDLFLTHDKQLANC